MSLTKGDLKAIKTIIDERTFNDRDIKVIQKIVDAKTLSGKDFEKIEELIGVVFDQKIEAKGLVTKDDISHLPTKEEFYKKENEVVKELQGVRDEIDVLSGLQTKVNDHDRKIEKIEKKLGIQTL